MMNISLEDAILVKNLNLSQGYGAQRLLSKGLKTWMHHTVC